MAGHGVKAGHGGSGGDARFQSGLVIQQHVQPLAFLGLAALILL